MPLANIRSIGPDWRALRAAAAKRSLRLVPDQKSRSKFSLSALTRISENILRKMAAQLAIDTTISNSMTSCTTMLAPRTRCRIDMSWFMRALSLWQVEFWRV